MENKLNEKQTQAYNALRALGVQPDKANTYASGNDMQPENSAFEQGMLNIASSLRDMPSDIVEGVTSAAESVGRRASNISNSWDSVENVDPNNSIDIANTLYGRGGDIGEVGTARKTYDDFSGRLYRTGQATALASELIGTAVQTGAKLFTTPEQEKAIGTELAKAVLGVTDTEAVKQGVERWRRYESNNPVTAQNIKSTGNIAAFVAEIWGVGLANKGRRAIANRLSDRTNRVFTTTASLVDDVDDVPRTLINSPLYSKPRYSTPLKDRLVNNQLRQAGEQVASDLADRAPRVGKRVQDFVENQATRRQGILKSTPAVGEAIRVGVDDLFLTRFQELEAGDYRVLKDINESAADPLRGAESVYAPLGGEADNMYSFINTERQRVGGQIGERVKELADDGTTIDIRQNYQTLDTLLRDNGINPTFTDDGVTLEISGHSRQTRNKIQELYDEITRLGTDVSPIDVYRLDQTFSQLKREARFEGISDIIIKTPDGKTQNLFDTFRDVARTALDDIDPTIRGLNRQYAPLRTLQDELDKTIFNQFSKYDSLKGIVERGDYTQNAFRRMFSTAQSAPSYRELTNLLETEARRLGYEGVSLEKTAQVVLDLLKYYPETGVQQTSMEGILRTTNSGRPQLSIGGIIQSGLRAGAPNLQDQQKAITELIEEAVRRGGDDSPTSLNSGGSPEIPSGGGGGLSPNTPSSPTTPSPTSTPSNPTGVSSLATQGQELANVLRGTKGMTVDDIMTTYPDIQLKRDVPAKDIYGNKAEIPQGEVLRPYEMKGNKVLLQDGEVYVVSKSQYQNIENNATSKEVEPFAPELEGTDVTVKTNRTALRDKLYADADAGRITIAERNAEIDKLGVPNETKYSSYQLSGGKNYREILIQAPQDFDVPLPSYAKAVKAPNGEWFIEVSGVGKASDFYPTKKEAIVAYNRGTIDENAGAFKSNHWDEPNVLAHFRMNERTYKGKKVAFLEELQSDWAKAGREEGFASDVALSWEKKAGGGLETIAKDRSIIEIMPVGSKFRLLGGKENSLDNSFNTIEEAKNYAQNYSGNGVPDNPLLDNWVELDLKRALQEAVDMEAEYFAWINGEQTSARYNLATHVDDVGWKKLGDSKHIEIKAKQGKDVVLEVGENGEISYSSGSDWKGKKLDEVLGKGLADKIMEKESGTLSGEGLSFGGEWASNLYDKQVPNTVKDLTEAKIIEMDMGLLITAERETWRIDKTGDLLKKAEQIKVGEQMTRASDSTEWVITDVLGDGKFKAVPKDIYERAKEQVRIRMQGNEDPDFNFTMDNVPNFTSKTESFDISTKTTIQQGIKLTPEVKAKIRGEAPDFEASGKQFNE